MEPAISIESIWEDESLLEVRIIASNGLFSATSDCYTNRDEIEKLATLIEGFPKKIGQEVQYTTGENDSISYFTLNLKCKDGSGHIIARVKIAHIVSYTNSEQENYVSEFDLRVEASGIDNFVSSLKKLSKAKLGEVEAKLYGII